MITPDIGIEVRTLYVSLPTIFIWIKWYLCGCGILYRVYVSLSLPKSINSLGTMYHLYIYGSIGKLLYAYDFNIEIIQ